jgi:CBS domain-containing protein
VLVREVMSSPVVSVPPETSIREAARIMADNHVGSVIVIKNGKVVGIVTDRDILLLLAEGSRNDFDSLPVSEIMTRYVHYIQAGSDVNRAVEMMTEFKVKKLPVLSGEKIVGIITVSDIAAAYPQIDENVKKMLLKTTKTRENSSISNP